MVLILMRHLSQLWNAIEATPSLQAVKRHWQDGAKKDFPLMAPLLRPTAIKAFSYPCGVNAGYCTRKITADSGKITAVCSEKQCGTLPLLEEDLICYELNPQELARTITEAMGIKLQFSAADYPNTYRIGECRAVPGKRVAVYLTLRGVIHFPEILTHIHIPTGTPFILLHPTRQHISHKIAALCKSANCHSIALEDIFGESDGKLTLLDSPENLMRSIFPISDNPNIPVFPTPKGAVWGDVAIQFKDGHTVTISCQSVNQTLNFAQMGMVNRRNGNPTYSWNLLKALAEQRGKVDWKSPIAHPTIKKQKTLLSGCLRQFFNLGTEPIPWDEKEKSYRAAFTLLPEGQ